jgi:O-antigen ligase
VPVAATVAVPVVLVPFLASPRLGIGLVLFAGLVIAASRSLAYPLGLAGAPAVVVGLLGFNPFPSGFVLLAVALWTLLALGLLLARGEPVLSASVLVRPAVLGTLGLALLMLWRSEASSAPELASFKVRLFIAVNVLSLIAGIVVGRRREAFDRWVIVALIVAASSGLVLIKGLLQGAAYSLDPGRISLSPEENPIWLARGAAQGMLLAVYVLVTSESRRVRLFAMATFVPLAVAVTASGSRGPVLGLIAGGATLAILTIADPERRRRLLLVALATVAGAAVAAAIVPGAALDRSLSVILGGESGLSTTGRNELWADAWQLFHAHPLLGIGTGGFSTTSVEAYPHNLLLETAAELGLVGLALLLVVLVAGASTMLRNVATGGDRARAGLVLALFAAAMVNAFLSGDITANAAVWLALGFALGQRVEDAAESPVEELRDAVDRRRLAAAR